MTPTRVLLVEDHDLVRAGFVSLLNLIPEVEVVAEAKNGSDALTLLQETIPQIILLDLELPDVNGIDLIPRMRQLVPSAKILILSMFIYEEYVIRALRSGASGYLVKDSSFSDLQKAIQSVLNSEVYLSAQVSRNVLDEYIQKHAETFTSPVQHEGTNGDTLTRRQKEILILIAEGKSIKEISRLLQISPKTVETHRAKLMDRLQIFDVAGLVRYAIRHKILAS